VNKAGCPVLLHARTDVNNVDCVRVLVEDFGADVNDRDAKGNTLLHLAAQDGNEYVGARLVFVV
jgi:ankyrin repeat protein